MSRGPRHPSRRTSSLLRTPEPVRLKARRPPVDGRRGSQNLFERAATIQLWRRTGRLERAEVGRSPAAAGNRDIAALLRAELGEETVCDDPWERRLYDHDIAPTLSLLEMVHRTIPDAVVRPRDARQVSEVLRLANIHRFPVIPRGAATWGLGGAVPATGGVVLDLTSLDRIVSIDSGDFRIVVEAGATWQKVIGAARRKGMHIGTYPSSFPAATVGGWIGVGGVGIGTCKYGRMSENLESLQVVLPDGSVARSAREVSRWPLVTFVGTEGIYGIITEASIRANPLPETVLPISFIFPKLSAAAPFMERLYSDIGPMHVMFADKANFDWLEVAGIRAGAGGALVTVVLEGAADEVETGAARSEGAALNSGGKRAPPGVAEREWRDRGYEFRMRKLGTGSLPGEVVMPLKEFGPAVEETYALIRRCRLNAAVIGTMADKGTFMLMPYYLIDERHPVKTMAAMAFNYRLAELAFRHGGRNVGLGMHFPFLLDKMYGGAEIERMRALKRELDPNGVLNPGKLLEARYGSGRRMSPASSRLSVKLMGALRSVMRKEMLPKADGTGTRQRAGKSGG